MTYPRSISRLCQMYLSPATTTQSGSFMGLRVYSPSRNLHKSLQTPRSDSALYPVGCGYDTKLRSRGNCSNLVWKTPVRYLSGPDSSKLTDPSPAATTHYGCIERVSRHAVRKCTEPFEHVVGADKTICSGSGVAMLEHGPLP